MHSQVSVNGNKEGVPIGDAFLYRADAYPLYGYALGWRTTIAEARYPL